MIFFPKYLKFYVDFENAIKVQEDVDGLEDDSVWTCCGSFCQFWQECMWLGVNVVKIGPKISNPTNTHNTRLNLFDINITLAWRCYRGDFCSVLNPLIGSFPKGVRKQEFKGIQVITFFRINNFGHIEATKVIFFSKCLKYYVDSENAIKVLEDVDGLDNNCVWTSSRIFCQLWQKYLWSSVTIVKSAPKIPHPTKRRDKQLNFFDIKGKLPWKHSVQTSAVFWTPWQIDFQRVFWNSGFTAFK